MLENLRKTGGDPITLVGGPVELEGRCALHVEFLIMEDKCYVVMEDIHRKSSILLS